jgi:hypothetical protein
MVALLRLQESPLAAQASARKFDDATDRTIPMTEPRVHADLDLVVAANDRTLATLISLSHPSRRA